MTDFKKTYEKEAVKFQLPAYETVNNLFEIADIEHDSFVLREIRRRICERLEAYAKIIEELIQPDTTMNNLQEAKDITDDQKTDIYNLYRDIMHKFRQGLLIGIKNDETASATYIINMVNSWPKTQEQLEKALVIMRDSWNESKSTEESLEYFG